MSDKKAISMLTEAEQHFNNLGSLRCCFKKLGISVGTTEPDGKVQCGCPTHLCGTIVGIKLSYNHPCVCVFIESPPGSKIVWSHDAIIDQWTYLVNQKPPKGTYNALNLIQVQTKSTDPLALISLPLLIPSSLYSSLLEFHADQERNKNCSIQRLENGLSHWIKLLQSYNITSEEKTTHVACELTPSLTNKIISERHQILHKRKTPCDLPLVPEGPLKLESIDVSNLPFLSFDSHPTIGGKGPSYFASLKNESSPDQSSSSSSTSASSSPVGLTDSETCEFPTTSLMILRDQSSTTETGFAFNAPHLTFDQHTSHSQHSYAPHFCLPAYRPHQI